MTPSLEVLLGIAAGLGLAAACGFRVFVPLLVVSIAARADLIRLHEGFEWIASTPAMVSLGAATALEIAAYYLPVVDNLLDTISTPAAAVAGAVVALAVIVDVDPWLYWTLGIVAGAGLASSVQVPTSAARAGSTLTTAGVANPFLSTGEAVSAGGVSVVAIAAPILIPLVLLAILVVLLRLRSRRAV